MDPKKMRKTIDDLLAELVRNPRIARRPTFMARYGRPLGLGLALGIGGVAGCGDDTGGVLRRDASPVRDAVPAQVDVYGSVADSLPTPAADVSPVTPDTADALPVSVDGYGAILDGSVDTRDALPPAVDIYGASDDRPPQNDTKDALPPAVDVYGAGDRPPLRDAPDSAVDGGDQTG